MAPIVDEIIVPQWIISFEVSTDCGFIGVGIMAPTSVFLLPVLAGLFAPYTNPKNTFQIHY